MQNQITAPCCWSTFTPSRHCPRIPVADLQSQSTASCVQKRIRMPESCSGALSINGCCASKTDQRELISNPLSALVLYQVKSSPKRRSSCTTSDQGLTSLSVLCFLKLPLRQALPTWRHLPSWLWPGLWYLSSTAALKNDRGKVSRLSRELARMRATEALPLHR